MDSLSDLRDNTGGRLIEWAQAPCPHTGKREGVIVDGETPAMFDLFESPYVSPALSKEDESETPAPRTLHQLVKNGLFYRAGDWVKNDGQLFDLLNHAEWSETWHLAERHGAELVAVENCVRD